MEEVLEWEDQGEQLPDAAASFLERVGRRRYNSVCDSGLGLDTDDDLTSLSRSSTYTTSEDGEEVLDKEGECETKSVAEVTKIKHRA